MDDPNDRPAPDDRDRLLRAVEDARAEALASSARVETLVAELREREERLRLALEGSGVGCWDVDPASGTYVWDDRCRELFGIPPDVPIRRATVDAAIHPDDREIVAHNRVDAFGRQDRFSYDFRVLLPDGRVRWLRSVGRPILGSDGRVVRVNGTVADLTAEREATAQKDRQDRWRDLLLGVLGHDLRSPLAAIRLSAELLGRGQLDARQEGHVKRIVASTDRMTLMIAQLLDTTRLKLSGGLPIASQPVDLGLLCREVVDEVVAAVPGAEVELDADDDVDVSADPHRLFQVVANLVQNALVHGEGKVQVRVAVDAGAAALTVTNHGRPIPEALRPTLFDPFVRGAGGSRSGLGLGLFISQQIVLAHGGTIDVTSSAEDGTTFRVRLPAR